MYRSMFYAKCGRQVLKSRRGCVDRVGRDHRLTDARYVLNLDIEYTGYGERHRRDNGIQNYIYGLGRDVVENKYDEAIST